ncbi:hypothetical protein AB0M95_08860 [Sphaerisporangium sp. NPDC051017]|uniref:hypothetical protein n=1 Tax=Sphaerisporangium sp. NPDC051017 TaxID=3154636 RepID=UPI003417F426
MSKSGHVGARTYGGAGTRGGSHGGRDDQGDRYVQHPASSPDRRVRGRHRLGGQLVTTVSPKVFDPAATAHAAHLDHLEPGWMIWYGLYDRRFHAIALIRGVEPARVEARTPEALTSYMREAESSTWPGGRS